MAAMADDRLGDTEHGSVREELEAAYRGDGDSGGGGGGESKVRQPPISDSGEGGGGESKAEGAFDPVEMLQTIRRENAQLASHGEAGPATWETLYGNMKTLYDYEKTQQKFYKRMIRQRCLGPKIKILEWNKSYKALTGCYIFRDVDRDTILGPNAEYNLGYLFPAVLSGPQGRQWVQGGQTEVDDIYNHEGDERSAWDEIAEFERDNKVVAWSPAHEANPEEVLPHFWYRQGHKLRYGVYLPGARHPTLNAPYGGHLEAVGGVPATPTRRTPAPLATSVKLIEEGERSDSIPYLSSEGVYASAIDDDVPNPDEMGGEEDENVEKRLAVKRKEKQNDYDEKNVKRKDAEKRKEQEENDN